jgi:hypothetical protein
MKKNIQWLADEQNNTQNNIESRYATDISSLDAYSQSVI